MRKVLADGDGYFCMLFSEAHEMLGGKCGEEWQQYAIDMHGINLLETGDGDAYCGRFHSSMGCGPPGGPERYYEVLRQQDVCSSLFVYCSAGRNQWSYFIFNRTMSPTTGRMQRRRRVAARIALMSRDRGLFGYGEAL